MDLLAASGVVATLLAAAATVWAVVYQQRMAAARVYVSLEEARRQVDAYREMTTRYLLEQNSSAPEVTSALRPTSVPALAPRDSQRRPLSNAERAQYATDIRTLSKVNTRAATLEGPEVAAFLERHRDVRDRVNAFLVRTAPTSAR